MNALPIIQRELRMASRRKTTYWSRVQMGLVVMLPTFLFLWLPGDVIPPAQRGAMIFSIVTTIALYGVVLGSALSAADCISSEKREGTLGFLFLTDLNPRDVLLGKISANSLAAVYSLLAFVPVLTIPVMLGGVVLMDLVRLIVVLTNTSFLALSVSVFVSTLVWEQRQAKTMTSLLLVGLGLVVPAVMAVVAAVAGGGTNWHWLLLASPTYATKLVTTTSYSAAPWAFWTSVGITHAVGWGFFGLACVLLPRVWQDKPAGGVRLRWKDWKRAMLLGNPAGRAGFRRALLDVNPLYWFASRERRSVWYPWLFLGAMVLLLGVWPAWYLGFRFIDNGFVLLGCIVVNWFFKHWIGTAACAAFSTDRDKGAMELLLSTKLGVGDFLRGHVLALRRQFLRPVVALLLIEAAVLALAVATNDLTDMTLLATFWNLAVVAMLVPDVVAMVWAGWWAGVVSKNTSTASSSAYLRVMIPPLAAMLVTAAIVVLVSSPVDDEVLGWQLLGVWLVISVVTDVLAIRICRHRLLRDMRTAIVERNAGGDPAMIWWRRLGRWLGREVAQRSRAFSKRTTPEGTQ